MGLSAKRYEVLAATWWREEDLSHDTNQVFYPTHTSIK